MTVASHDPLIYGVPASRIRKQIADYERINRKMEPWTRAPRRWFAVFPYGEWIAFNESRIAHYKAQLRTFGLEI